MPVTATYTAAQFKLSVLGTGDPDAIAVSRDAAGTLLVNNGSVAITGGTATVANTSLVEAVGEAGNDTILLDEALGALPPAEFYGGAGNDALTGGSGGDTLSGEADNDTLLGKGGVDLLFGGEGNDTLTGGDADDQMFGEGGDDRMIWNPGDDTDLMEGGLGSDITEVNGGNGDETFTVTANGTRVRFDRVTPAPFSLDIGTTESLVLNANGGNDTISTSGNIAALIALTLDGGAGNDTILGGNGADTLLGGDGNDFVDGNQGNDVAFLGTGDDTFQWDPGDGSDVVEGQAGTDTLLFNGSAANEIFALSANGARAQFTRNVGNIVMDVNDLEAFTINLLGGTDTFTVSNLTGTDATTIAVNLSGTIGGSTGDAAVDSLFVEGSATADTITVTGAGTSFSVSGLTATLTVTNSEAANDKLTVNGLGGNDSITASTLPAGVVLLSIDGGTGNDTILGSQAADVLIGGDGDDSVFGDNGNDTAFLGAGNDVFEWAPGDGNDIIEGQGDIDELRFAGSNANETINVAANGGRILFTRDVASVTMDMDDVESIVFNAFGGADNVTVGDLTGTDAVTVVLRLAASGGGGDGAIDTVTVNNTNAADAVAVASSGSDVFVTGLPWSVVVQGAEAANDRLTVNGQGGDDVINASTLAAGLISLTVNAGLGNDLVVGSAGGDTVVGGDGNDTALLGGGNDVFVWNPGDDNDIVEGQAGTDTLTFNGANIAETITISPNGGRALFLRDVAAVTMDLNDTETIQFAALGGADTIVIDDMSGTDVTQVKLDLASTIGGATGDSQIDTLNMSATAGNDSISLSGATGALLTVTGLPGTVTISQFETSGTVDKLTISAFGGNDSISALGLTPHFTTLTIDGGIGNDTIRSNGDGTYLGGVGDDMMFAGLTTSLELINGGDGIDTLDTQTFAGTYTVNMVTGLTSFAGESFTNFENLITGDGDDTVTGTDAANVIRTNGGVDHVVAGDGNDKVEGGAQGDTLDGGLGIDTLAYNSSDAGVTVSLAAGTASGGHAAGDSITGFENITGSGFADVLTGDTGANALDGLAGADSLSGGLGDDSYYVDSASDVVNESAGQGTDRIFASASYVLAAGVAVETLSTVSAPATTAINLTGNELANNVFGNFGNNVLFGGGGNDVIIAHDGNDVLVGGVGADSMSGGLGDDSYYVDNAGDTVGESAGQGNDRIYSSINYTLAAGLSIETLATNDAAATTAITLTGNELANAISGNAGNNLLSGGSGNDVLTGGGGIDTMSGGLGDDQFYVDNAGDAISEAAGQGNDRVFSSVSYTLATGVSVETLSTDNAAGTTAINLTGNDLANSVFGNNGNNSLNGGSANDTLIGQDGNDMLVGGAGTDTMSGGLGDDWYYTDSSTDVVSEAAGQGNDRIFTNSNYVLAAGISVETVSTDNAAGTTAITLIGNDLANNLYGNFGNNSLYGSNGNDVIIAHDGNDLLNGGAGADSLSGGAGADTFVFANAAGPGNIDTIADYNVADDTIQIDDAIFTGLSLGALAAGAFNTGASATQADDRIIYNSATGALLFDADGTGATAAVQFATLSTGLAMTASEFFVI